MRSHMMSPNLGGPNVQSVIPMSDGIKTNGMLYMYVIYEICYVLGEILKE